MHTVTRRTCLAGTAGLVVAAPGLAQPGLAQPALRTPALRTGPADPLVAAALDRPLFGAALWTLPNGLRVVHVDSPRVPVVAHYLFYGAGGGEDPAGRSGLAHFLEHMMFKGSRAVAAGAFSLAVAREGGQDNAFTSRDVTAYHQTVEASRLPLVMRMEADRAGWPAFPAAAGVAERDVVLEERRQVVESNPRARFFEAFEAAMWGRQHWRGRPIIGWPEEIRALDRDDMLAFHAGRYAPANAVLVVAGDVREAALRQLALEHYGPIEARPVAPRARPLPTAVGAPRFERREPQVREATLLRAAAAPSLTHGDAGHAWALELLAHLLGSGQGSRLHRALVEPGLATTASASYDAETLGPASFTISATLRPGIAPERLEAALDAMVAGLLQDGPTAAERDRSLRQITAGATLALDGLAGAPRMLGSALAIGLPLETVEYWPRRLAEVTREQVAAAGRAVLGPLLDPAAAPRPELTGAVPRPELTGAVPRPELTGWLLPA